MDVSLCDQKVKWKWDVDIKRRQKSVDLMNISTMHWKEFELKWNKSVKKRIKYTHVYVHLILMLYGYSGMTMVKCKKRCLRLNRVVLTNYNVWSFLLCRIKMQTKKNGWKWHAEKWRTRTHNRAQPMYLIIIIIINLHRGCSKKGQR